jgi:CBS domain-containing protein
MQVREVMNTDVVTAEPETPIGEVARRMAEADVGSVVILEGGKPVGIVTDRDLVIQHLAKGHTQDHLVHEAPSGGILSHLVTIAPDLDVLEAARELGRHKVGRLPVVEHDRLVGMLSAGDLAYELRRAMDGLLAEGAKAEQ